MTKPAHIGRAIRLRACLLAAAWLVSGFYAVGHVLEHHQDEHHSAHVERVASDPQPSLVAAHGHGHDHAMPLSDASLGKAPRLEAPTLLLVTPDVAATGASLRWLARATPVQAGPGRPDALGPRAPPSS